MDKEIALIKERIKKLEMLFFFSIAFTTSYAFLISPSKSFFEKLSPFGSMLISIIFLLIFLFSYLGLIIYFTKLVEAVAIGGRNDLKNFFEKKIPWLEPFLEQNKNRIGYPIIIFSGIFIVKYILDYDWETIIGTIILGFIVVLIQKIGGKKKKKRQKKLILR